jgi:hypothetical protein
MFIKDIKPELLVKLTADQLKVVERWDREAQELAKLIPSICAAYNSGDKELAKKLGKEILDSDAARCEHGRDKHGTCIGCSEIEAILWPESEDE